MLNATVILRFQYVFCLVLLTLFCGSCNNTHQSDTGFYYWKQDFQLNRAQTNVLKGAGPANLYVRFFDIKWDIRSQKPYPEAIINFKDQNVDYNITPVVFITNQTFEKLDQSDIDSLALKCNKLIAALALKYHISYKAVQIDCDWTVGTKDKYFSFLHSFKNISNKTLEVTIRLHQVKYQFKTGVPPADRGVLMFYNMGKISADLNEPNSIYNAPTAKKYVNSLKNYLLPLDVALPVFSWSIHIREGKVIQVYGKIGRAELNDKANFSPTAHRVVYRAKRDFFMGGIYIKKGDLFKVEETDKILLKHAAVQLAAHLNKNEKRTIIYYELGNLNLSAFKAKDFEEISAYF
ncbi:hypothetical protein [Pedobacter nyackensis]|uniref:hypothetical protein n=1 Tax=Pedobacter nyackensis TaxID=475255 RepID=UPI00292EA08C|nr:hypothetical protein [Pedobacter nyackensis]